MIARDHGQRAITLAEKTRDEIVIAPQGRLGRVGGIEDIPGQNDGIHRMFFCRR